MIRRPNLFSDRSLHLIDLRKFHNQFIWVVVAPAKTRCRKASQARRQH